MSEGDKTAEQYFSEINQPPADPRDFTGKYNTPLKPENEKKFQQWMQQAGAKQKRDMSQDLYDYDLRGAFLSGAERAANGHLPDTYKKPNHPTFSVESQYNGADGYQGGTWTTDKKGRDVYTASDSHMKLWAPGDLQAYFKQVEPTAVLILPSVKQGTP